MSSQPTLRIGFAGTPGFGELALRGLISEGFTPVCVLTQPDRPAGRGRKLQASPIKKVAEETGIAVFQPDNLKTPDSVARLRDLHLDLLIVVAYGLILPKDVLTLPRFGCWNIHASLLPRWRGAAPIQRAIEAGDRETGVCIMQMEEGLDTGPVLKRDAIVIQPDETGGSLHDRLADLGATALLRCMHRLANNDLPNAVPQAGNGITYARKLVKAEAEIDWRQSAIKLERKVRAFNPWPVCWCDLGGERTRIWSAKASAGEKGMAVGKVLSTDSRKIEVVTGDGLLTLMQLQRPGGRPISAAEYLNARHLPANLATGD